MINITSNNDVHSISDNDMSLAREIVNFALNKHDITECECDIKFVTLIKTGCSGMCYELDDQKFEIHVSVLRNWIVTLGHELYHVHEFINNLQCSETDCDAFGLEVLARFGERTNVSTGIRWVDEPKRI